MDDRTDEDLVVEEEIESGDEALKKLREKLKKCVSEKQEYLDGWQRLKADFANEKKDAARALLSAREDAAAEIAEKLIPLVDSFDLAFSSPAWKNVDDAWRVGVERLKAEVLRILKDLDVVTYSPEGEAFDPSTMTASREVEGEEGIVIAVDRIGFKQKEKVIRPAYVALGK